jgi:hypothetical protein
MADGKKKIRRATAQLREVDSQIRAAADVDPEADTSAANARRAKAEGWSRTTWQGWPNVPTPRQ